MNNYSFYENGKIYKIGGDMQEKRKILGDVTVCLLSGEININTSPITEFLTDDAKTMLRSLYDRGLLSKQTTTELLGEVSYDIEVIRKEIEDIGKKINYYIGRI